MNMIQTIIPKSDQLNSDDLIGRTMTVTITGVEFKSGDEQPVWVRFDGDNGKPYKVCKSMRRVMVQVWGADAKEYVGRSMTLYRDPDVVFAGQKVGGIRISHMSHLEEPKTMALTATRASRKPFTVRPLVVAAQAPSEPPSDPYAAHLQAIHAAASMDSLKAAFNAAWIVAKAASDEGAKTKLKAAYDERKATIEGDKA